MASILSGKTSSGTINIQNANPLLGVPTVGSFVAFNAQAYGTLTLQTVGTYTGALSIQVRLNSTNWVTLGGTPLLNLATGTFLPTITSALQSVFQLDVSALSEVRVSALAAVTGSVVVTGRLTEAVGLIGIDTPLPAGAAAIGSVTLGAPLTATTTSITKAEDAVHATSDSGVMALGVQYPTLVSPNASGDYGFIQIDDLNKQVIMPFAPTVNQTQGITAAMTGTASTQVIAAGAAGVRNYVAGLTLTNTHATVGTEIDILDGAGIIDRIYVPALQTVNKIYPTPLKGTAATALNVQNVTTASNTYVQAVGFVAL